MEWRVAVSFDESVGRYLADVIGLPVHTQGLSEEEALANAKAAIALHLKAVESLAPTGDPKTKVVRVEA